MSSACTSTLPNTRLCSVSTRRRPSRPWSVPNRRSPYGLAAPCGTRTTIGGTGSSISSPPLRSRRGNRDPPFQCQPYGGGLPPVYEEGRPHLSGPATPCHSRQRLRRTIRQDVRAWQSRWSAHPRVHFHYTPTSASWFRWYQIEVLFRQSWPNSRCHSSTSPRSGRYHDHLVASLRAWNRK